MDEMPKEFATEQSRRALRLAEQLKEQTKDLSPQDAGMLVGMAYGVMLHDNLVSKWDKKERERRAGTMNETISRTLELGMVLSKFRGQILKADA